MSRLTHACSAAAVIALAAPSLVFAQEANDATAIRAAETLLKEVARTYAQAPALRDSVILTFITPTGEQKQELQIALQAGDALINVADSAITAVDGRIFVTREAVDDKYAEFAVSGDLASALEESMGFSVPHIAMRRTEPFAEAAAIASAWVLDLLPQPTITGSSRKTIEGVELQEIMLKSEGGDGAVIVDPKTKLVRSARARMTPPGAPEGFELRGTITYAPQIVEKLDKTIAFEPGSRAKVSSVEDLRVDIAGKPAPDFTLPTLEGASVTLSELKGNVVVLDFWATWCGPCKRALPKLQAFADWARENDQPVKVFAVDVMEQGEPQAIKGAVESYWKSQKYTMPVLMDYANLTPQKYHFQAIPTTVIIDPKGVVHRVETGYHENMEEMLKGMVEQMLSKQ